MSKIIVLIGAPCSGKTVLAHKMHKEDPNKVIVNRDDIRDARGTYWIQDQEDYISDIEEFEVKSAVKRGLTPIIDATNLNPKTMNKWKALAEELQCELEEIKMPYVPFVEALRRDTERGKTGGRSVGLKVLTSFYKRYYPEQYLKEVCVDKCPSSPIDPSKVSAVIFDLDRTLMYRNGRDIYDYEAADTDVVDPQGLELLKTFIRAGIKIFISTGRELTPTSIECIHTALKIPTVSSQKYYPYLILGRTSGDHKKSTLLKEENLNKIMQEYGCNVIAAFDDDEECVEMYRNHGIFACKIN